MKIWITRDEKGWLRDFLIAWTIKPELKDGRFIDGKDCIKFSTGYSGIVVKDIEREISGEYFKKHFGNPPKKGECKRFTVTNPHIVQRLEEFQHAALNPGDTCRNDLWQRFSGG